MKVNPEGLQSLSLYPKNRPLEIEGLKELKVNPDLLERSKHLEEERHAREAQRAREVGAEEIPDSYFELRGSVKLGKSEFWHERASGVWGRHFYESGENLGYSGLSERLDEYKKLHRIHHRLFGDPPAGQDMTLLSQTSKGNAFIQEGLATLKVGEALGRIAINLGKGGLSREGRLDLEARDLFKLDSNRDGYLDADDEFFGDLKVAFYEKGERREVELSAILSSLDLRDYLKTPPLDDGAPARRKEQARITQELEARLTPPDPFSAFIDPKHRHRSVTATESKRFFQALAGKTGKNGWVDLSPDRLNAAGVSFNFSYKKRNLQGEEFLQKISLLPSKAAWERNLKQPEQSYEGYLNSLKGHDRGSRRDELQAIASEYEAIWRAEEAFLARASSGESARGLGLKPALYELEDRFESLTGMRFSKENLRRVKEELAKGEGVLELMPDDDFAVAMRQNEDGGFMLKFASGRVVSVDELYIDTLEALELPQGQATRLMSGAEIVALDENQDGAIEAEETDFERLGYQVDDRLITLKEAGVRAIRFSRFDSHEGKVSRFYLELLFNNGETEEIKALHRVKNPSEKIKDKKALERFLAHPYTPRGLKTPEFEAQG